MAEMCRLLQNSPENDFKYIRYIKTFEVIFNRNNLSGMHISAMWLACIFLPCGIV